MDNMILAISYGHIIWPLSYGTNHTLHIIRYISHIVYDIRHIICRPRVIHIFSGYQTGISLEVDILYNLNGLWKQRKRNLFKSVVIISDKIVDFSEYSSGEQLFSKNEIIPFLAEGLHEKNLPDKSILLFHHKDVVNHILHLSVMHIFDNIHIHPRKFPFLVCTVGDLFFVQLKRLLGNRMVDMLLGIEHHFSIYIALPENLIEK